MYASKKHTLDFIKAIEQYPSLWRKEEKDFSNKEVRKELFDIVANETGIPVPVCKKRLKVLKDRMRGVCHGLPRTETGKPDFSLGKGLVSWPYYKNMLFMSDQFLGLRCKSKQMEEPDPPNDTEGEYYSCLVSDSDEDNESNDCKDQQMAVSKEMLFPEQSISSSHSVSSSGQGVKRKAMDFSGAAGNGGSRIQISDTISIRELSEQEEPGVSTSLRMMRCKDMWDAFSLDMNYDLHLVTDLALQIDTKAKIRRIVEQAVQEQLARGKKF